MTFLAKIFDVYKHHAVICISILILGISLRLADLNIYFYDVFFICKKSSKKGIYVLSMLRIRLLSLNTFSYKDFDVAYNIS